MVMSSSGVQYHYESVMRQGGPVGRMLRRVVLQAKLRRQRGQVHRGMQSRYEAVKAVTRQRSH
jgi:hypothetical protein